MPVIKLYCKEIAVYLAVAMTVMKNILSLDDLKISAPGGCHSRLLCRKPSDSA